MHRKKQIFRKQLLVIFILSVCFFSCDREKEPYGTLTLEIHHKIGQEELQLNERIYNNEANNQYEVARLRYLLSDFVLETDTGLYKIEEAHFYDIQNNGLVNGTTSFKVAPISFLNHEF